MSGSARPGATDADAIASLAERLTGLLQSEPPHIVGIGGAVAVGKSTVARALAEHFAQRGRRVEVVATDAFLYPNAALEARGLTMRKGFPETFDLEALRNFFARIRERAPRIEIPIYSHATYDVVPGEVTVVEDVDLVIVEGVIALQPGVVEALDASIYIDADERDVREWFVARFIELTQGARNDPASFYSVFAPMQADEVRRIAEATWDGINGVNLAEHILPSRERATLLVEKARDHSISRVG